MFKKDGLVILVCVSTYIIFVAIFYTGLHINVSGEEGWLQLLYYIAATLIFLMMWFLWPIIGRAFPKKPESHIIIKPFYIVIKYIFIPFLIIIPFFLLVITSVMFLEYLFL